MFETICTYIEKYNLKAESLANSTPEVWVKIYGLSEICIYKYSNSYDYCLFTGRTLQEVYNWFISGKYEELKTEEDILEYITD